MSKLIDIDWSPNDKTLRQFGFIALGGFAFVALLAWQEWLVFAGGLGDARPYVAGGLLGLGALSALLSLVFPRANWPIYAGLTAIALPIGFVLSYVIMATLFYLIIMPIGFLLRLFGKDPLDRRFLPEAKSYWVDAAPPQPKERYFRQY